MPKLTFFYIVEPPDYEIMACTLLASIRAYFGNEVGAIGYCPEHRMAELHPGVVKAHEMMGAELRPMRTEGMWDERRCCRTQSVEDSHRESMRLDVSDDQAPMRPLPDDELEVLQ